MKKTLLLGPLLLALGLAPTAPALAAKATLPARAQQALATATSAKITTPTPTDVFQEPASLTIHVATVDNTKGRQAQKVEFFSNGAKLGEQVLFRNSAETFFFNWTGVAAGKYTLTARFTASNGSTVTTAPVVTTINAAAPATGPVAATLYKDCNYGGPAVALTPGDYSTAQLAAKGIADKDISAVKVSSGYKVELYSQDGFRGREVLVQADAACLGSGADGIPAYWNNATSALRIVPVAATSFAPFVDIISPGYNAAFSAPATINLQILTGSNDHVLNKAEFFSGTTLIGTVGDNSTVLQGGSAEPVQVSFNWTGVPAGTYTVTAKVTAFDGVATTSAPLTITVAGASSPLAAAPKTNFSLAPSAAANQLDVLSDSPATVSTVAIYADSGRPVGTTTGTAAGQVDLSHLNNGLYYLVIQGSDGTVQKKKVLIQR